jgi:hypothetical protein
VWDLVAGRELLRVPELGRRPYSNPMFSPDGRYAAVGQLGSVVVLRLPEPAAPAKP